MDFIDQIRAIATQIPKLKENGLIKTEEGTKNALIMPFINGLGYNVFDPMEVTPELVADVGVKKGEKVDYAILKDGKPIMLFECKAFGADLNTVHASQLYRYFSVTEARFGILTNGAVYQFYADLDSPNKMDEKPFLVFDLNDIKEPMVEELKRFTKAAFNVDQILSTANELKYTNALKRIIVSQLAAPSDEFVRFFAGQVYTGRMTQQAMIQFRELTKRAWREVITDRMKETFTKAALAQDEKATEDAQAQPIAQQPGVAEVTPDGRIITTEDELEAYRVVRAIVREVVDVKRVTMRDAQSYCSILLDDNNRRPICRIYFNSPIKRYIGLFDNQRQEEKLSITGVDDLFSFADRLKAAVKMYTVGEKEKA
jgi:predicted type IV restriction endonuclease